MILNNKRSLLTWILIAAFEVLFFFFSVHYISFSPSPIRDSSDDHHELVYSRNVPLHSGALFSQKVEQIIIYSSKNNCHFFSRFSCICADDKIYAHITRFNREVFQIIQLGTTCEFNCELQIQISVQMNLSVQSISLYLSGINLRLFGRPNFHII
jgi:hypothetical protein